jgi:hypothetical protein
MPPTVFNPGRSYSSNTTPPSAQRRHRGLEVGDLPTHLRVGARRRAGGDEQGERPAPTAIAQAAGPLLGGLQAELVRIERAGTLEVLDREPCRDVTVCEHTASISLAGRMAPGYVDTPLTGPL